MMFPPPAGYFEKMRKESDSLPHVEVTEEEFIRLMEQTGMSEDRARTQAKVSKGLGAWTRIGQQMVKVKEVSNVEPGPSAGHDGGERHAPQEDVPGGEVSSA